MEITKTELMNVVESSCSEVFIEMKDDAKKIVTDEIIPAVAAAKNSFISDLKKESETASSGVKLRNSAIIIAIKFASVVATKIVAKIFADPKPTPVANQATTETPATESATNAAPQQ